MASNDVQKVVPFEGSKLSKKEQIAHMFDDIAGRYDFLNHFMSMGIDVQWRKKALKLLLPLRPKTILDVATGTGDVAIMAQRMLKPEKITGIDISEGMLALGREKVAKAGLDSVITLQQGDSETISFPDATFDAITAAFGVRNFENLEKGLAEMCRKFPKMEHFSRVKANFGYIGIQQRLLAMMNKSARERYVSFISQYPDMQQRIPKQLIARYLGVSRETLSRFST